MTKDASQQVSAQEPVCAQVSCEAEVFLEGATTSSFCETNLPHEHVLAVYEEDRLLMRITCTPEFLHELVVGRLFSEGYIASLKDLSSFELDAQGTLARVTFGSGCQERPSAVNVPTHGVTGRLFAPGENRSQVVPISWRVEDLFELAREFAKDTPVHIATGGAHSCYLAQGSKVLFCCEDLGRHNALDKVIGWALLSGVDLRHSLVFSSGRIPADMVGKVIRSGIPILVTKAVPTDLAVRMAREANLTLVCQAHPDSLKIFNRASG